VGVSSEDRSDDTKESFCNNTEHEPNKSYRYLSYEIAMKNSGEKKIRRENQNGGLHETDNHIYVEEVNFEI
jgi:hypothetical protein